MTRAGRPPEPTRRNRTPHRRECFSGAIKTQTVVRRTHFSAKLAGGVPPLTTPCDGGETADLAHGPAIAEDRRAGQTRRQRASR
jgi:hypothetical protein